MKLVPNQAELLQDYVDSKIKVTPIMNLQWGSINGKRYDINKAIKKVCNDNGIDKIKKRFKLIFNERDYAHFFIYISTTISDKPLNQKFGEGILHNHFGEGSGDGGFVKLKRKQCLSYIFKTDDDLIVMAHLDHRGTSWEISPTCTSEQYDSICASIVQIAIDYDKDVVNEYVKLCNRH
jgi:hypothetical protein